MCVAVFSNIRQLPACQVFRVTHSDYAVNGVHLIPVGFLLEPRGTYLFLPFPDAHLSARFAFHLFFSFF